MLGDLGESTPRSRCAVAAVCDAGLQREGSAAAAGNSNAVRRAVGDALSSRRLRLMRLTNWPPRIALPSAAARGSPASSRRTPTCPMRSSDCGALGLRHDGRVVGPDTGTTPRAAAHGSILAPAQPAKTRSRQPDRSRRGRSRQRSTKVAAAGTNRPRVERRASSTAIADASDASLPIGECAVRMRRRRAAGERAVGHAPTANRAVASAGAAAAGGRGRNPTREAPARATMSATISRARPATRLRDVTLTARRVRSRCRCRTGRRSAPAPRAFESAGGRRCLRRACRRSAPPARPGRAGSAAAPRSEQQDERDQRHLHVAHRPDAQTPLDSADFSIVGRVNGSRRPGLGEARTVDGRGPRHQGNRNRRSRPATADRGAASGHDTERHPGGRIRKSATVRRIGLGRHRPVACEIAVGSAPDRRRRRCRH